MIYRNARGAFAVGTILATSLIYPYRANAQTPFVIQNSQAGKESLGGSDGSAIKYADPVQGVSAADLVSRALQSNAELAAVRLEVERARARFRHAGLFPNPTVEFEQTTGSFTGSPGERATSLGVSFPFEIGGKRRRRIELATAEIAASEAEVADRERKLAGEVRTAYVEALAALRELQITGDLNDLDVQTARVVEARVTEGESARVELELLRVELDRLRSRRALAEGKLQAAVLNLKRLAGMAPNDALQLREDLRISVVPDTPQSIETAITFALQNRPDLQLAKLNEQAAQASLRLAQSEAKSDLSVSARYSTERQVIDLPSPFIPFTDPSKTLAFGVSIELPLFKRNQRAIAEAATTIAQAQRRREFAEHVVRSEVASAYARYRAAQRSQELFEQGVLARSDANIRILREAYRMGAFRITELISEQRRLADSQREYTEVLTERYKALADLQTALGVK